jgi:hypothetical protein
MMAELGDTVVADEVVIEGAIEDNVSLQGSMSVSIALKGGKEEGGERETEKTVFQNLERYVQRIRMAAQQIIQGTLKVFDPD